MRKYAKLGQWMFRWEKNDSSKLCKISLTKHRCQKVLNAAALANGTLKQFVALALDGSEKKDEEHHNWVAFLEQYLGAMDMLTQSEE